MRKVKVWDLFVRFFHWGLAAAVLGSFLTSESDGLVHLHARIGLAVLALVVALLAVLLGLVATGALAYAGPEFGGVLAGTLSKGAAHGIKEVHEALTGLLLGLVATHVLGVVASSFVERQNLVKGMVTGWKRDPEATSPAPPGLGLSIAQAIAEAHGAALELADRPGGGLVVRVRLPP